MRAKKVHDTRQNMVILGPVQTGKGRTTAFLMCIPFGWLPLSWHSGALEVWGEAVPLQKAGQHSRGQSAASGKNTELKVLAALPADLLHLQNTLVSDNRSHKHAMASFRVSKGHRSVAQVPSGRCWMCGTRADGRASPEQGACGYVQTLLNPVYFWLKTQRWLQGKTQQRD